MRKWGRRRNPEQMRRCNAYLARSRVQSHYCDGQDSANHPKAACMEKGATDNAAELDDYWSLAINVHLKNTTWNHSHGIVRRREIRGLPALPIHAIHPTSLTPRSSRLRGPVAVSRENIPNRCPQNPRPPATRNGVEREPATRAGSQNANKLKESALSDSLS